MNSPYEADNADTHRGNGTCRLNGNKQTKTTVRYQATAANVQNQKRIRETMSSPDGKIDAVQNAPSRSWAMEEGKQNQKSVINKDQPKEEIQAAKALTEQRRRKQQSRSVWQEDTHGQTAEHSSGRSSSGGRPRHIGRVLGWRAAAMALLPAVE